MNNYKNLFMENIILIALIFFVVLYIIYNYQEVRMNRLSGNNVSKCLLITCIFILIIYLLFNWNEEEIIIIEKDSIKIPKYELVKDINKKYSLVNDSLNTKLSNQNIFISHKNRNKYGLAF